MGMRAFTLIAIGSFVSACGSSTSSDPDAAAGQRDAAAQQRDAAAGQRDAAGTPADAAGGVGADAADEEDAEARECPFSSPCIPGVCEPARTLRVVVSVNAEFAGVHAYESSCISQVRAIDGGCFTTDQFVDFLDDHDAGDIELGGVAGGPVTLSLEDGERTHSFDEPPVSTGETVTATSSGGADFSSFSSEAETPAALSNVQMEAGAFGDPLHVTWTPAGEGHVLLGLLGDRSVVCPGLPDTGSFAIPGSMTAKMEDSGFTPTLFYGNSVRHRATLGDSEDLVDLLVSRSYDSIDVEFDD